ncbi:hypothetical protein [Streptomyces sp. NPDC059631]|uniref:hypothetical protein n=1 Tax=unclassified Streptomyces TaxID=2593676 RepID=UPI0036C2238E
MRKTRFLATSVPSRSDPGTPEQSQGVGALPCFVSSAGFSGGHSAVSHRAAPEIASLQEQIRITEAKTAAVPKTGDAEHGLTAALTAAGQVAKLQNDYRYVTPSVAADGGTLEAAASQSTLRNLIPYFTPPVHQADLGPWYLLASDKDVAAGVGIPMSFSPGFEWVAQVPYLVNDDSTITGTWPAIKTRTGTGERLAVLAWADADYGLVREAFVNIQTGTTATGETLEQEVKAP